MEPREIQATGTLPIEGGTVAPVPGEQPAAPAPAAWLPEARAELTVPGRYLAYELDGRRVVTPLNREWTRIGRSLAADVRFDDATVSRRHAQIVAQGGEVKVLDDRSLNGVYVNGRRVEECSLADGDQVVIGRHAIYFLDTATVGSPVKQPLAAAE
jgi:pSer/pThr/pTyr-binding forkhead associated (FHA) protein